MRIWIGCIARPVLPEAARLIAERGLRYVYGLGIHASPSLSMRGEVTRPVPPGGLYGVRHSANVTDITSALDWFPTWRDHGWLPSGDGNGDHYVYITKGELTGCVGFVDQDRKAGAGEAFEQRGSVRVALRQLAQPRRERIATAPRSMRTILPGDWPMQ